MIAGSAKTANAAKTRDSRGVRPLTEMCEPEVAYARSFFTSIQSGYESVDVYASTPLLENIFAIRGIAIVTKLL
jgi:hypothetical protein